MHVKIYFEIPNREECDTIFEYLRDHPRDIWDYEERVKQKWIEARFNPNFHAHWSDTDILSTDVTRTDDSNMIHVSVYKKVLLVATGGSKHGIKERMKTSGLQTQAMTIK